MVDQFKFGQDRQGHFVRFMGRKCKSHQGGLKETGCLPLKDIKQYVSATNPRCYVKLLREYLSFVPDSGAFYRRPLPPKQSGDVRFSKQKVGIHQFESVVQRMCSEAGLKGNFTGHSGKVSDREIVFFTLICVHSILLQMYCE